jgi:succinate-acetate transporter protein
MEEKLSNPAPLGLMGFGMTTVLLNLHNSGLFPLGTMILAMGIFYGGMAQIIAGAMEFRKGNTFGTVAFSSYGLFWLSLVGLIVMGKMGLPGAANGAMIAYFIAWGFFTFFMFFGTLKLNAALQVIFGSLTILFWLLAIRDITGSTAIGTITGIEGILCGLSAVYLSVAEILNEVYGRTVLPIGPVQK